MNEQEAFEEWYCQEFDREGPLQKLRDGRFADYDVSIRFAAWHAALAWLRSQEGKFEAAHLEALGLSTPSPREYGRKMYEAGKRSVAPQPAIPDGWQPIETAPKDGTYVLVSNGRGVWVARYKAVYESGWKPACPWQSMMLNHDHIPSTQRKGHPTHWMPLPAAPEYKK